MFKRYGAAIVLAIFFFGSWAGQALTFWHEFVLEQAMHHAPVVLSDYLYQFGARTFENWQSEFLQVMAAAWVFKHFFWQGSPESKEPDEAN